MGSGGEETEEGRHFCALDAGGRRNPPAAALPPSPVARHTHATRIPFLTLPCLSSARAMDTTTTTHANDSHAPTKQVVYMRTTTDRKRIAALVKALGCSKEQIMFSPTTKCASNLQKQLLIHLAAGAPVTKLTGDGGKSAGIRNVELDVIETPLKEYAETAILYHHVATDRYFLDPVIAVKTLNVEKRLASAYRMPVIREMAEETIMKGRTYIVVSGTKIPLFSLFYDEERKILKPPGLQCFDDHFMKTTEGHREERATVAGIFKELFKDNSKLILPKTNLSIHLNDARETVSDGFPSILHYYQSSSRKGVVVEPSETGVSFLYPLCTFLDNTKNVVEGFYDDAELRREIGKHANDDVLELASTNVFSKTDKKFIDSLKACRQEEQGDEEEEEEEEEDASLSTSAILPCTKTAPEPTTEVEQPVLLPETVEATTKAVGAKRKRNDDDDNEQTLTKLPNTGIGGYGCFVFHRPMYAF